MTYAAMAACLLAGCCLDDPDGCWAVELADGGVDTPCWTRGVTPVRTTATAAAPPGPLRVQGCAALRDGRCVDGALARAGILNQHLYLPAGEWTTTARGDGCPDRDCAAEVGYARAWLVEPPLSFFNTLEAEYAIGCRDLTGRPRAGPPAWIADCAAPLGFRAEATGVADRWRLLDQMNWPSGLDRAAALAALFACTQRLCAALNTFDNPEIDRERDGVAAACDVCPQHVDPDQRDRDGDRVGDACDGCPADFDPDQADRDGDGIGDACDVCPRLPDAQQRDRDGDGVGDACDRCPDDADPEQADADGDRIGDACDVCPGVPDREQADGDGDGVGDACDLCPERPDPQQRDADGDGVGDACDVCPDHPGPARRSRRPVADAGHPRVRYRRRRGL